MTEEDRHNLVLPEGGRERIICGFNFIGRDGFTGSALALASHGMAGYLAQTISQPGVWRGLHRIRARNIRWLLVDRLVRDNSRRIGSVHVSWPNSRCRPL